MRLIAGEDRRAIDALAARVVGRDRRVDPVVRRILASVRRGGDEALRRWVRRLDGPAGDLDDLVVPPRALRRAWDETPRDLRQAIRLAARHLRRVASRQRATGFRVEVRPGVVVEQRVEALRRVGCYVPGGRYPLPSTLLMTAVPARVAGVEDVVVACPRPAPAVLAAALEAEVSTVYRMGGAQAIAALAYGTETVARVDKIVGPGNAWVAAAKRQVAGLCGLDLEAGPSEIVVWSASGDPAWIAADLVAQAEHDPDARAIFVTTRRTLAERVRREVRDRAPISGPARTSLRRHGAIIVARSRATAAAIIDRLAPEHLVVDSADDAARCRAGAVFVGPWSAQAAGDYCLGSNHVLPTSGSARWRGGLSALDFQRIVSVQTVSRAGIRAVGPSAAALADAEGLAAHAASIRLRLA